MKQFHQSPLGMEGLKWFIGVVEDRNDPMQIGRLRVRIHGWYTDDKTLIPTELLPWSIPIMPITSASSSGVGMSPVGPMIGTTVLGFWMDYPNCQTPAILGTINAEESSRILSGGLIDGNMINDSIAGGPGTMNPTGDGPPWLQIARGEIGTIEWKGSSHNPEVLKYGKDLGFTTDDGSHPWCAAFVYWCIKSAGLSTKGLTGAAKSSMRAPCLEPLSSPLYGCIAVKHRSANSKNSPYGHVGFWVGRSGGYDKYLGGNQGNKVSIASFSISAHAGYYWPKGQPKELANNKNSHEVDNSSTGVDVSQG